MQTNRKKPNTYLSKSLFIKGLQCYKYLYLEKYHPELKDEISEAQQAIFDSGTDVGIYAQQLFSGGLEIPYEGLSHEEQLRKTAEAIESGTGVIYEAAFSFENVFVKADIMRKTGKGWEIYEVKSSTSVKEVYLDDIAVQYYTVNGATLPVSKVFLVHINNQYVRQGDIDVKGLFSVQDVTDIVLEKQPCISRQLKNIRDMLMGQMPEIDIGLHCNDPYACQFLGHCWKHIPTPSVFDIRNRLNKFELYQQGIIRLEDVPFEILSNGQRLQVEGALQKKNFVNREAVSAFLNSLWYPLCFLDFETTFMTAIPLFDGTRPYQQVPFQYSLHILRDADAELEHYEYLADAGTDPRRWFIESLLERIPENACVLTYNKTFEEGRLADCAVWFPERAQKIESVVNNIRDLMLLFKNKEVYYWQMQGSYSLKDVLPPLVPELSYETLEIGDGEMASSAWLNMSCLNDRQEIEKIRAALLEYCRLDTLSMVRILNKLKEICR